MIYFNIKRMSDGELMLGCSVSSPIEAIKRLMYYRTHYTEYVFEIVDTYCEFTCDIPTGRTLN